MKSAPTASKAAIVGITLVLIVRISARESGRREKGGLFI